MWSIEYVGYAASFFVLLSFIMKDMKTLRLVNIIGCSFFVAYGFLIEGISWPLVVTNVAIVIVNIYYLIRLKMGTE
jgi:hypothetical protein